MHGRSALAFIVVSGSAMGCASASRTPAGTVEVPAGPSWSGSSLEARAGAVEFLADAYGQQAMAPLTRLQAEAPPRSVAIEGFHIMAHPVTQAEYANFARSNGAPEPWIDPVRWEAQGTGFPYATVERFMWSEGLPKPERQHHPVVLVDRNDAQRYCAWWGRQAGGIGTLPSEAQWNRAAGGDDGTAFPWGDAHDVTHANTWETGVGDTTPVGAAPEDASMFGVHDLAGNVFEWTRTRTDGGESVLKGGSWSTSLVEARVAARQPAPDDLRHVTVGFRCVFEPQKAG